MNKIGVFFALCIVLLSTNSYCYKAQFINKSNPTKAVYLCIPQTTECAMVAEVLPFSASQVLEITGGYLETRCTNREGLFIIHPLRYHNVDSRGVHVYQLP